MQIIDFFKSGDARSILAKKNIVALFFNKMLAAFISLQLIPVTIDYVNPSQYGIWLTLSSVVAWMAYFDMGLTHGFRNNFAIAKAQGNMELAKQYVSTSYAILTIVFSILAVFFLVINMNVSWGSLLNINSNLDSTLIKVFSVLVVFFSLQMIFQVFSTMLLADQKPAYSAIIITSGQLLALIIVYILTKKTEGNLVYLAFALSGSPCLMLISISVFGFMFKYRIYKPDIRCINWKLSKNILTLGGRFFVIQLSMLLVFQFSNIILARCVGPDAVTVYNIAYRYFSVIYVFMGIIFLPFWSAFTDAYTNGEYDWMRKTYNKLSKIWTISLLVFIVMLLLSPLVYKYWLSSSIAIDFKLSVVMGINMLIFSRANLYMYCINGTGKVLVQLIVYLVFAVVSIPLMIYFCEKWGCYGIIIVTSLVYLSQMICGHLQLNKILNKKDYGLWGK